MIYIPMRARKKHLLLDIDQVWIRCRKKGKKERKRKRKYRDDGFGDGINDIRTNIHNLRGYIAARNLYRERDQGTRNWWRDILLIKIGESRRGPIGNKIARSNAALEGVEGREGGSRKEGKISRGPMEKS